MASAEVDATPLSVTVAASPAAGEVVEVSLQLPAGATLKEAVIASGLQARLAAWAGESVEAGLWGRRRPPDTPLRDGDRVELYRPLSVDPKEARRQRQARQGLKPRLRR